MCPHILVFRVNLFSSAIKINPNLQIIETNWFIIQIIKKIHDGVFGFLKQRCKDLSRVQQHDFDLISRRVHNNFIWHLLFTFFFWDKWDEIEHIQTKRRLNKKTTLEWRTPLLTLISRRVHNHFWHGKSSLFFPFLWDKKEKKSSIYKPRGDSKTT